MMPANNLRRNLQALCVITLFICFIPVNSSAAQHLAYYSDYFSFIGRDASGYVAFALDNNRGVDGPDYQAEHFGVMYDQKAGWVPLSGAGDYANTQGLPERSGGNQSEAARLLGISRTSVWKQIKKYNLTATR